MIPESTTPDPVIHLTCGELYTYISYFHKNTKPVVPFNFTGIIIDEHGSKGYYKNGVMNREDGPAHINMDGRLEYVINGKTTRFDGPALIYPNGIKRFYIENIEYSEDDFKKEVKKRELITPNYFKNML